MTEDELEYFKDVVDTEGIDYALTCYSDFKKIKDKKFHELRFAFLKARKELIEYTEIID